MTPVRILGIGSPFGADRLGWQAIDVLEEVADWPLPVELMRLDRPGVNLLTALEGLAGAMLIDALAGEDGPPRCLDPQNLAPAGRLSSHAAGVADVLRLGQALERLPPRLAIVGIPAEAKSLDGKRLIRIVRDQLQAWAG